TGKHISEVMPQAFTDPYFSLVREVRASGERHSFDYELQINGKRRWYTADMDLHEDKGSIVVTVAEITKRKQAELDLRNAEREWRNTFDSIPDLVSVLTNEFDIVKANRSMSETLGMLPEELIGKKCYELMHLSSEPFPGCPHLETIKTGLPAFSENYELCMGKSYSVTTSPIQDDQGKQVGVVHIAKDISERVEAEKTIKESESQFRAIFEEAGIGMALVMNGHITEANSAFIKLLGYDENEIRHLTISDITHPDDRGMDQAALQDLIASDKKSYELEKRYIRRDGEIVWGKLTVSLIRDPEGTQHYSIGMVEDVTETKVAQSALKESESRLRANFEQAGIGMALVLMNGEIVEANLALQEFLGYDIEELLQMNTVNFTHPEDIEKDNIALQNMLEAEKTRYQIEKRYIRKDGEIVWGRLTVSLIKDADGTPQYTIGMVEDITALSHSEQKYRTLIENVQNGIQIAQDGITVFANEVLGDMLGYSVNELVGAPFSNHIVPEDLERIKDSYRKRIDGEVPSEYDIRLIHKNGTLKHARLKAANFEYEGKLSTIATITDVTERRKTEDDLRESEQRYRLLYENLSDGLFITNIEGIITMCSSQGAGLFGATPDEIIGTHFVKSIHPDYRETVIQKFREGYENRETQPKGQEIRGIHLDGSELYYHITNTLLMENGEPSGYQSLIRDITDLKQIEAALQESELRFRQIVESTPMGIHMYELDFNDELIFRGANPAADRLLGVDNDQFIGKTIEQAFPSAAETEIPNRYRKVALEGRTWSSEHINYEDTIISGAFEIHAYQTGPRKMVASFFDITDRKVAEQAAAISQENFHTVFETIDDLVFIVGLDAKILTTNHSVRDLLGYSEEELQGLDVLSIHPQDRREEAKEILKDMMEGKTTICPIPLMAKDGTLIPVETRITLGRWSGEEVLFGVSRDITQRINAEKLLMKTTQDLGERVKELTCLYGTARLLGSPHISMKDTFQRLMELLPSAWKYSEVACVRMTINGEEYSSSNFRHSRWKQTADISFRGKTAGILEVHYLEERPDHDEGPFLKEERDLLNQIAKSIGEFTERRKSDDSLRKQKMELSELAHIMSHDLGNNMKTIRGLISVLKSQYNEDVLERIDRLAHQTSQLLQSSSSLADSGLVVEENEIINLNHVVQEIASTIIPDDVRFEMDSLPIILGDSQRITQIIKNLFDNAVEHGKPTVIEVRTRKTRSGIIILVKNDGEILPEADRGNIFLRGFTTKGKGRGLGLAIVKKL
ncbi:MAG: PAS domain-containing sensor histidine kinase, partial [Candidatus Thorarchaeota archaeon]